MPARQASRAATLGSKGAPGNKSAPGDRSAAAGSDSGSVIAKLVIVDPAPIRSTGNGAYGYHNV
jgi:hypothetical protein